MFPFIFLAVLEGAVLAALLSLMAVGLSLVFGILRIVNIAHGQFFMLGAVIGWVIAEGLRVYLGWYPLPAFLLALPVVVVSVASLAWLSERLVLRKLAYEPQAVIVATIGLLYIFQQGTLSLFGGSARAIEPPFYILLELPWYGYSVYKLLIIPIAAVVLFLVWWVLERTRLGLMIRATAADRDMAAVFAIQPSQIYACVFAAAAGLAALAGLLALPIRQAHYLMGDEVLLLSFIVVIIGGLGRTTGAILGGTILASILIGMSDALVSLLFSPVLAKIIAILLVVAVLIIRPQGLMGTRHET